MAHEITAVDSAAYMQQAWHGLGKVLNRTMTSDEVLEVAGLTWTVNKVQLQRSDNGALVTGAHALVRYDTDEVICPAVGEEFKVIQNVDLLRPATALVASNEAIWTSAFSIKRGAIVCLVAKLPIEIVLPGEDITSLYLTTLGKHGLGANSVYLTAVESVCWNTIMMGLAQAKHMLKVPHSGDTEAKMDRASSDMGLFNKMARQFAEAAEALYRKRVDALATQAYFRAFAGVEDNDNAPTKNQADVVEMLNRIYLDDRVGLGITDDNRGTAWGLLRATTQYSTHHGRNGNLEKKLASVVEGARADKSRLAFSLALDLLK